MAHRVVVSALRIVFGASLCASSAQVDTVYHGKLPGCDDAVLQR